MTRIIPMVLSVLVFCGIIHAQSCHSMGSMSQNDKTAMSSESKASQPQVQTKCPVMGNTVDPSVSVIWEGDENHTAKKVYFCCPMCIDKFKANPIKYIKKLKAMKQPIENAAVAQDAWICTMCPDVKSEKSGSCPKCGMQLVKKEPTINNN